MLSRKWEYKRVFESEAGWLAGTGTWNIEPLLNRYGEEGWELVAVMGHAFLLMRPKAPEPGQCSDCGEQTDGRDYLCGTCRKLLNSEE